MNRVHRDSNEVLFSNSLNLLRRPVRTQTQHPEQQRHHRPQVHLWKFDRVPRQGGRPLPEGPDDKLHSKPGAAGPADKRAPTGCEGVRAGSLDLVDLQLASDQGKVA